MKHKNIFWGAVLIIAALVLLFNKLGYFHGINGFSIVASVFLLATLVDSLIRVNFGGILFSLAFIGILFDEQLGITAITPWTILLAALLGTIGLSLIFHKKRHHWFSHNNKELELYGGEDAMTEDEGHIKIRNSFGSTIRYINSDCLERVDVTSEFGAVNLYFDNAVLKDGKACINFDLSFAGAEIYVPKTWTVVFRTSNSFSGVSEKNLNESNGENTLTLFGNLSFSGVTVIYI